MTFDTEQDKQNVFNIVRDSQVTGNYQQAATFAQVVQDLLVKIQNATVTNPGPVGAPAGGSNKSTKNDKKKKGNAGAYGE